MSASFAGMSLWFGSWVVAFLTDNIIFPQLDSFSPTIRPRATRRKCPPGFAGPNDPQSATTRCVSSVPYCLPCFESHTNHQPWFDAAGPRGWTRFPLETRFRLDGYQDPRWPRCRKREFEFGQRTGRGRITRGQPIQACTSDFTNCQGHRKAWLANATGTAAQGTRRDTCLSCQIGDSTVGIGKLFHPPCQALHPRVFYFCRTCHKNQTDILICNEQC